MLQLEVNMSPWQYRDGYADRIAELLVQGAFVGCPGKWRVHRKLAAVELARACAVTVEVRRVTFEIDPVDAVARRVEATPDAPEALP